MISKLNRTDTNRKNYNSVAYEKASLLPKSSMTDVWRSVAQELNISLARGEAINHNTKDIDREDRTHLIGEKKSLYNLADMNPTLEKYLKWEKSHFRPRYILTVICPFLSIVIIGLLRGSRLFSSIAGVEV